MASRKKFLFFICIFLSLFSILCCEKLDAQIVKNKSYEILLNTILSHSAKEISVNAIKNDTDIVWLDAREKNEYEVSKINGAIWVGYKNFSLESVKKISKDDKIVVYCSVGYRSEKITERLIANGYKNVYNLVGGIFEWLNQKKTVVDNNNNPTNKIHGYSKLWGIWVNVGEKVYN